VKHAVFIAVSETDENDQTGARDVSFTVRCDHDATVIKLGDRCSLLPPTISLSIWRLRQIIPLDYTNSQI
jgi:hypothetical protein